MLGINTQCTFLMALYYSRVLLRLLPVKIASNGVKMLYDIIVEVIIYQTCYFISQALCIEEEVVYSVVVYRICVRLRLHYIVYVLIYHM